ncbi:hypothetical protein O181_067727 [Austropuccinia psidii MF-1]|uniref:Uncharacterized protein n=1 Tax=Austropuccinia psidii MF-1 TaxID=1389203 RepID=A0A9Q3I5K7_9BASI|nr:hypothetical protein [Austropuccinia psidii MF-1]
MHQPTSKGLGQYISRRNIRRLHTNSDGLTRCPLDNVKSNPAYDPEVVAKLPIHFIEIEWRKNLRFSEWAPEGSTPDSEETESEGTETPILGIGCSELHNYFFAAVMKTYSKHKQCGILLKLLQQKNRITELECKLEHPLLRYYKENKFFLIDGLLYHREKHTSALTVVHRDHISLILQACHDFSYMGHMSEDRTKESIASTALLPKWEQELKFNNLKVPKKIRDSFAGPFTIIKLIGKNSVEVRLTEEFCRKHLVFPVSLVKPYFQTGEERFPSRKRSTTPPDIVKVEDSPGPVKKIIKARKF